MIRPSPELEAIARRWAHARATNDAQTISNLFSTSPALSYIGSAEGEIWNAQQLREVFGSYVDEIPQFRVEITDIKGWENGPVGWVRMTTQVQTPSTGVTANFRNTHIFTLEDGIWKIVHQHISNPVSNEASVGRQISSIDELLAAAQEAQTEISGAGPASIMFTDIANSSTLAEALGDTRWAEIVGAHLDLVEDAVRAHGGQVVKSLGDGTMSSFAGAGDAMRAACDLQRRLSEAKGEPQLQIRVGIHTGDVVADRNDFFGTVVNKAARIAAIATPGDVLVSETTRVMVGQTAGFSFCDPITLQLRGLEGEHLMHRLEWDA